MAADVLANHLIFATALFAASFALTWAMLRVRILDVPNERSSHAAPVPSGGGVAIVLTFLAGFAALYFFSDDTRLREPHMISFALAALGIALVSLVDDVGHLKTFKMKLTVQILAAIILTAGGVVFRKLSIPVLGVVDLGLMAYPITVIWVVAMTNIFNFMDGLDGLAGGTCIIVALFFGALTFIEGSFFVYILSYVILSSALGFIFFNFPKARIFMGDVGSQFLGFVFAAIAVIAAEHDASRTSFLIMPLLFFNFIFDTTFTFFRRLLAGEHVTEAHRGHLYQLMNRLGVSHVRVSLFHFAVTILQGLAALWLIGLDANHRALVFLPFFVFQTVYAVVIVRLARRNGILTSRTGAGPPRTTQATAPPPKLP